MSCQICHSWFCKCPPMASITVRATETFDGVALPKLSFDDSLHFGATSTRRLNELRVEAVLADRAARQTICTRAAEILEREAKALLEGNTYLAGPHKGEWTEASAHIDHDEMLRVASELREAAA